MDSRPNADLSITVYHELRLLAQHALRNERPDLSLNATALVHEAYLRLHTLTGLERRAYFAAASTAMRRILIDHARARLAEKRGGRGGGKSKPNRLSLSDIADVERPEEILAVDEALLRLEEQDVEAAEIVRLRFFAGLSVAETAEAVGKPLRSVERTWQAARAFLFRELSP